MQITKSSRLEDIRLTILNNLMFFHPESTYELAWGLKSSGGYESDGSPPQTLGVRSRCVRWTLSFLREVTTLEAKWRVQIAARCEGTHVSPLSS